LRSTSRFHESEKSFKNTQAKYLEFYYICPKNAQYIFTKFKALLNVFEVFTLTSGSLLLCMLKLQIKKMKTFLQVVVTKNR
jgi:hypothetical protein